MALRLSERFVVDAPAAPVWAFLVDPRRVVGCVPGGELAAVLDDRTFDGKLRVQVGPFTFAYGGRVRLAEADTAARRVKILGYARESGGDGSARLALESWLTPLPGGATEVVANARVEIAGPVVALGRPALEQLGHVVFQDFAGCVAATIEAEHAARATGSPSPSIARARPPTLRAVPVVLRALRAWVRGWFRPRASVPGDVPRTDEPHADVRHTDTR